MENQINNFLDTVKKEIGGVEDHLRSDYFRFTGSELLESDNISIRNTMTQLTSVNGLDMFEKVELEKKECEQVVLIAQYYKARDEKRQNENNVCLLNNITNPKIDVIYLLNEEYYDLSEIMNCVSMQNRLKVRQKIIGNRMGFYDAIDFANNYCKDSIVIISNLDIFFNESIRQVCKCNMDNMIFSLSRYDLKNEYNFSGSNSVEKFVHEGPLGNPCIDSHDCWIFKSPIKLLDKEYSNVLLGSHGCDTIFNYIYGELLGYKIVNPVNSIISIHYQLETKRDSIEGLRCSSGKSNIEFNPENYKHKYVLQKSLVFCNKIESFCTFCTKSSYKDLRLLLLSLELYHNDMPVYIIADSAIKTMVENDNYSLDIKIRVELDKYTDMNRQIMEELDIFTEFLLKKADVMDYALEENDTVLFLDSDIMLLNKMDLLVDSKYDVGLSRHNIKEEYSSKFGIYNAGFMYIKNKSVTDYWRPLIKDKNTFYEQQCMDNFKDNYEVYEFDNSYNYGWWRLFQSDDVNKCMNKFVINNNNIHYEYKTLKCVHTHFYQNNDGMVIEFNKIIRMFMDKIGHKMLCNIENNEGVIEQEITKQEEIKQEINEEIMNQEVMESVNKTDKVNIIIPRQPRGDFWNHSNDTFRELVMLWERDNLCNVIEKDTKHVWWGNIGEILLYDRPIMEWKEKDNELIYEKILVGNPVYNKETMGVGSQWIFWGRRPSVLESVISKGILEYENRTIRSIFVGKVENHVQKKYRIDDGIEWNKYVDLYKMHNPNENYVYSNEEYLDLLRHSKFGLCLRGYGGKCNREIELMGLGVVPIVMDDVDMSYYNNLVVNVHYFVVSNGEEFKEIVDNCSKEHWTLMSNAVLEWYNKNCSSVGSFNTTKNIIEGLCNSDNRTGTLVYSTCDYDKFVRKNLSSYYDVNNIMENHKRIHGDVAWDNENRFSKGSNVEIMYITDVKVNTEGVMYNDEKVYEYNGIYDKKLITKKKEVVDLGDDNMVVFNLVQRWGYGYYHWMAEIYSKLFLIKEYLSSGVLRNKKVVLMLYYNDTFIKECLEIVGIEDVNILPYNGEYEYKIKNVYMCNPIRYGNPGRENISMIRNGLFGNNVLIGNVNIIIKRVGGERVINNFDEMVKALLSKYGEYKWVIFENLSMIDTIKLFGCARLIIGAHGAGLTNMIFSPKGAKVIELMTEEMGNVCYWHLAELLGLNYKIVQTGGNSSSGLDVDVVKLNYTVGKLLNNVFTVENTYLK
tara:strand:- start:123 stop:3845 length:3723 start_codon:yes stop_codon:yes gene_type:complete